MTSSLPAATGIPARLRRRVGPGRTRRLVLDLRGRLQGTQRELQALRRTVEEHRRDTRKRLDQQAASLRDLSDRLTPFERASNLRALEHGRFSLQIGTVEERLGALEQRLGDGTFVADEEDAAHARALVDEVRREHAQIRARMQVVAAYEERLRRVEASVAELDKGDLRHQV